MVERLPGGLRSDTDFRALYDQWQRQKMGEVAAPDRYGADRGLAMGRLLPPRMSKDPAIDQILQQARKDPVYREGDRMGSGLHPDYALGQQPPPLPPTLQQQPQWTREPVDPNEVGGYVAPLDPEANYFENTWS